MNNYSAVAMTYIIGHKAEYIVGKAVILNY